MLLSVVAHKVSWFRALTMFCDIVFGYSQSVMVKCATLFCDVIVFSCSQSVMV